MKVDQNSKNVDSGPPPPQLDLSDLLSVHPWVGPSESVLSVSSVVEGALVVLRVSVYGAKQSSASTARCC